MKKLNIRMKLMMMVVPLAIFFVIAVAVLIGQIVSTKSSAEEIYYDQLFQVSDALIGADRDFYQAAYAELQYKTGAGYEDEATLKAHLDDYETNAAQVKEGIENVQRLVNEHPAVGAYVHNGRSIAEMAGAALNHFNSWYNAYKPATDEGEYADQIRAFEIAREEINNMQEIVEAYAIEEDAILDSSVNRAIFAVCGVILVIYIVMAIFCVYVIRYIRIGITSVTGSVEKIADKDLTEKIPANDYEDEIGRLSRAAASLQGSLQGIMGSIKGSSQELAEHSETMATNTRDSAESMQNIDVAVSELANTATSQANDVEHIASQMSDITNIVVQSVDSTKELDKACGDISDLTNAGMKNVDGLTDITKKNVAAFENIFRAIDGINEKTKKIGSASSLITDIASQTNLLSLNASIEAARAGEAGRGFAVVADEIRQLAEQSAGSAQTINEIIEELVASADDAMEQSKLVSQYVEEQKRSVEETRTSFESIVRSIETVNHGVETLNQVNTTLDNGVENINNLVDSLAAASEENAATAEELTATTTTVAASVEDLKDTGVSIHDASQTLSDIIGQFRI